MSNHRGGLNFSDLPKHVRVAHKAAENYGDKNGRDNDEFRRLKNIAEDVRDEYYRQVGLGDDYVRARKPRTPLSDEQKSARRAARRAAIAAALAAMTPEQRAARQDEILARIAAMPDTVPPPKEPVRNMAKTRKLKALHLEVEEDLIYTDPKSSCNFAHRKNREIGSNHENNYAMTDGRLLPEALDRAETQGWIEAIYDHWLVPFRVIESFRLTQKGKIEATDDFKHWFDSKGIALMQRPMLFDFVDVYDYETKMLKP